jgi:hypothetical protein
MRSHMFRYKCLNISEDSTASIFHVMWSEIGSVSSEVLAVFSMIITVLPDVTPCSLCCGTDNNFHCDQFCVLLSLLSNCNS